QTKSQNGRPVEQAVVEQMEVELLCAAASQPLHRALFDGLALGIDQTLHLCVHIWCVRVRGVCRFFQCCVCSYCSADELGLNENELVGVVALTHGLQHISQRALACTHILTLTQRRTHTCTASTALVSCAWSAWPAGVRPSSCRSSHTYCACT